MCRRKSDIIYTCFLLVLGVHSRQEPGLCIQDMVVFRWFQTMSLYISYSIDAGMEAVLVLCRLPLYKQDRFQLACDEFMIWKQNYYLKEFSNYLQHQNTS